jgi:hypothetical protein
VRTINILEQLDIETGAAACGEGRRRRWDKPNNAQILKNRA